MRVQHGDGLLSCEFIVASQKITVSRLGLLVCLGFYTRDSLFGFPS